MKGHGLSLVLISAILGGHGSQQAAAQQLQPADHSDVVDTFDTRDEACAACAVCRDSASSNQSSELTMQSSWMQRKCQSWTADSRCMFYQRSIDAKYAICFSASTEKYRGYIAAGDDCIRESMSGNGLLVYTDWIACTT